MDTIATASGMRILNKGGSIQYGIEYHIDGTVRFFVNDGSNARECIGVKVIRGDWHHIVCAKTNNKNNSIH